MDAKTQKFPWLAIGGAIVICICCVVTAPYLYVVLGLSELFLDGWSNQSNGRRIVGGLERYYEVNGIYPETLDLLVPTYLNAIQQPDTPHLDWLYITSEHDFVLGYIVSVNWAGYTVCVFTSTAPNFDCMPSYEGVARQFDLPPTPFHSIVTNVPMR